VRDDETLNVFVDVKDVECAVDWDAVKDPDGLAVFTIELDTDEDAVGVCVSETLGVGNVGDKDGEVDLEWLPEALA